MFEISHEDNTHSLLMVLMMTIMLLYLVKGKAKRKLIPTYMLTQHIETGYLVIKTIQEIADINF